MKQVEKIWSEMAAKKAELATHKVELSILKELEKLTQAAKDIQMDLRDSQGEIENAMQALNRAAENVGNELQYAEAIDSDIETVIREAMKAAEALGYDGPIPEVDDANERRDSLRKVFNEVYELYKKI